MTRAQIKQEIIDQIRKEKKIRKELSDAWIFDVYETTFTAHGVVKILERLDELESEVRKR